jgi:endonuclease YncB( thermonuclease family)
MWRCVLIGLMVFNQAWALEGVVVKVQDGDTITVLDSQNQQHKIRLSDIDAPETKQAFGERAKQYISSLVFQKRVTVEDKGKDMYGRTIGRVFVNNIDVNEDMVFQGLAIHYKRYSKDPKIAAAEQNAKTNKRGLWIDPNAIPPEQFRRDQKHQKNLAQSQDIDTPKKSKEHKPKKGKKCGKGYISQDKVCHKD